MVRIHRLTRFIVPLANALAALVAGCERQSMPMDRNVPAPPKRIIALAPNAVEILWSLGVEDRLVAVSEYTTYPPQARSLPRIGGVRDPDLEAILALQPDLIILRGRQDRLESLCQRRGIGTYHDPTEQLPDLYRTITRLGETCDRREQAARLIQQIRADLAKVKTSVAGRPPTRVLLCMRDPARLANITTVARGSYLHDLIEIAGGVNVFGELDVPYPRVSIEEIVARQPDVILEAMPGWTPTDDPTSLIEQWQELDTIPAVRNRRIHVLTEDYVLIPSPRVTLLAQALVRLLHPDLPADHGGHRDE